MSPGKCQSVLYVDDDPDICEVVQATLGLMEGLDVHIAGSGEQAIDLAYEIRPDLILMDVMMPGLDGPTTFKRIRSSPVIADIPVIFLTAKVLPTELAHFLQLGAIGVIGKPFDPLKLADELFALWTAADRGRGMTAPPSGRPEVKVAANSLADGFLHRTRGDVPRLIELLERARAGDRAVLQEVERIAHSIHGAGALFGFPRLSAAGAAIERIVEGAIANTLTPDPTAELAMLQQLVNLTQRLAQEVETAGKTPPGGDGLIQGRSTGR
jgi:two-component system OmpR family response regulator